MQMQERVKRLGLVLVALLAVVGIAGGVQGIQNHQQSAAVEEAQERSSFWRGIAGEASTSAPTVENQLAKDLSAALGPVNPSATDLPPAVQSFKGNTSAYGGVSEALNMSPFVNSGCNECGALTAEMQENLLLIKQGNVGLVVQNDTPPGPDGYTLTPFGVPVPVALGLVALAGGAYLFVPLVGERRKEAALENRIRTVYGTCLEELDEIERALDKAQPVTAKDREALDELRRTSQGTRKRLRQIALTGEDQDISPTVATLHLRVNDLNAGIEVRQQVYRDLNGGVAS